MFIRHRQHRQHPLLCLPTWQVAVSQQLWSPLGLLVGSFKQASLTILLFATGLTSVTSTTVISATTSHSTSSSDSYNTRITIIIYAAAAVVVLISVVIISVSLAVWWCNRSEQPHKPPTQEPVVVSSTMPIGVESVAVHVPRQEADVTTNPSNAPTNGATSSIATFNTFDAPLVAPANVNDDRECC